MSIITRCPACATAFRVTPSQLQAQHGLVRCGRCAHVFDGFKTLAKLGDDGPLVAVVPPVASQPEFSAAGQGPHTVVPVPPPAAEPSSRRRSGWAFGSVLLLFVLAAQGVYFYRGDIVAVAPETRPYLDRMCELLDCTAALPQRPQLVSIEASDMQAIDPARPGVIALTATLRSRAATALGYPALDVVLTDTKEHAVARRIFLPAEYLGADRDVNAGIPPNAEVTIRLDIDSGALGAAGFRLDLLPAPTR